MKRLLAPLCVSLLVMGCAHHPASCDRMCHGNTAATCCHKSCDKPCNSQKTGQDKPCPHSKGQNCHEKGGVKTAQ